MDVPSRHTGWLSDWLGPGELPIQPEELEEFAALAREDHYAPGETVFRIGQAPTRVHIVRDGAIELSRLLKGLARAVALSHFPIDLRDESGCVAAFLSALGRKTAARK